MRERRTGRLRDAQREPALARCGQCMGEVYPEEPVYCPEEGVVI